MKNVKFYQKANQYINLGEIWDMMAPRKDSAIEFAHEFINQEPEKEDENGNWSWQRKLAHYGEYINDRFRRDEPSEMDMEIASHIETCITRIPLILYRGVGEPVFKQMENDAKDMEGVDLYQKSFLQTSLVKGQELNEHYHLRIFVPAGAQAVYLGNVNDEQHFYEVDLQHGSKLKIVSMDEKYINCILLL